MFSKTNRLQIDDFDYYEREVIGQGRFAEVVKVLHKPTSKYYALKVLKKDDVLRHNQTKRTFKEREIHMEIHDHPNTHYLHGTLKTATKLYFVMDLSEGGELSRYLIKKPLSVQGARYVASELVKFIDYLYGKHKIVHSHLNPENICFTKDLRVKVIDFGIAFRTGIRVYSNSQTEAVDSVLELIHGRFNASRYSLKTRYICPKDLFFPPELMDKTQDVRTDSRSNSIDIWSLGVLLYHMLTKNYPFVEDSNNFHPHSVIENMKKGKLKFPYGFDIQARDLIEKLLQMEPSERLGVDEFDNLKAHSFFNGIDFLLKECDPPVSLYLGSVVDPDSKERKDYMVDYCSTIWRENDSNGDHSSSPKKSLIRFKVGNSVNLEFPRFFFL